MNYLFSGPSLKILESLSFTNTLYAFDFDGTLAPIVDDPAVAAMTNVTASLFARLSERVPTAIISGRGLSDLRSRVSISTRYLIGNHGLEGLPDACSIQDLRKQCISWKAILEKRVLKDLNDPGIWLEDKEYSLAIHYRKSRKKKRARNHILNVTNSIGSDVRVVPGKLVFNLVPAGAPHKGIALSRVMKHAGTKFGFFIGDDDTDEDVFEMADHRVLTVRVGSTAKSQAQYYIRRQSDINQMLRKILKFHGV